MQAAEQLRTAAAAHFCCSAGVAPDVEHRSQLVLQVMQAAGVAAAEQADMASAVVAYRSTRPTATVMTAAGEEVTMKMEAVATT